MLVYLEASEISAEQSLAERKELSGLSLEERSQRSENTSELISKNSNSLVL